MWSVKFFPGNGQGVITRRTSNVERKFAGVPVVLLHYVLRFTFYVQPSSPHHEQRGRGADADVVFGVAEKLG